MKSIIAAIVLCFGLILAIPSNANVPRVDADSIPAMTGTVGPGPQMACFADDLNRETKATLNRWRELNAKREAGTITEEELVEGGTLAAHQEMRLDPATGAVAIVLVGKCGVLPEGLPVTVLLLDGLDYFVAAPDGQTFIVKGDGFQRD